MFDTIILLTGPVEEAALTGVLRGHRPGLRICPAKSLADLKAFEPEFLRRARLIGFVTDAVVPTRILKALGFGAYNFHSGPPHYPGWVPAHFAIYERAVTFGATAHCDGHHRIDLNITLHGCVFRYAAPEKTTGAPSISPAEKVAEPA